jgi:thiol-disulfide isomerase/thioredoxin
MKMKSFFKFLLLFLILFSMGSLSAVELGDPAAPLLMKDWVKGEPVTLEKGTIYVVEFWATWCGPCLTSIPHLTELQKKYKDQGVVFIGISDEDDPTVRPFVDKMGDTMDYWVAADPERKTYSTYMTAYKQNGIPTAFIVDRDLNTVWLGHPMGGLDKALEEVIGGTYDIEAIRAAHFAEQQLPEYFRLVQIGSGNEARKLGEKILAGGKDSPTLLNQLAWKIVSSGNVKTRDLDLGMKAAQAAYDGSDGKTPFIVDTLARAYYESGNIDKAIDYQKKAVDLSLDGPKKDELAATLRKYEDKRTE